MTWTTPTLSYPGAHKRAGLRAGSHPVRPLLLAVVLAAGLILALLPIRWAIIALLGLTTIGLVLVRPERALYLLCFAIPFGSLWEIGVGGGITVGVTEALIGLLVAAWLARTMAWRKDFGWPQSTIPLLLFVGVTVLSLLNATSLSHAAKEIFKWIEFMMVMLVAANLSQLDPAGRQKQSQRVIACLLLAGSGQAIWGAYQFLTRSGPESFAIGRFMRAYGTFEQPNPYAGYLGLVAPLALALILESLKQTRFRKMSQASEQLPDSLPTWLKWLAVASFAATSIAIGMSASRGAWLAFAAAFVAVNVSSSRRGAALFLALLVLALLAGLVGGFGLLPVGITERLTGFLPLVGAGDVRSIEITDANYASLERLAFWQAALDMWRDRPVLGVGIGNYPIAYARYSLPKWRMALGHAHNYYLNIAAEIGLLGLLAYLLLWGTAVWQTGRALLQARDAYTRALALGALGLFVHVHVHNIVDNLWVHNMYIHVAIVLGLVQSRFGPIRRLGDAACLD